MKPQRQPGSGKCEWEVYSIYGGWLLSGSSWAWAWFIAKEGDDERTKRESGGRLERMCVSRIRDRRELTRWLCVWVGVCTPKGRRRGKTRDKTKNLDLNHDKKSFWKKQMCRWHFIAFNIISKTWVVPCLSHCEGWDWLQHLMTITRKSS